jgi:hypothetical protein
MPLRIEVRDSNSGLIRLEPRGAPYGYSEPCPSSSLQFHAAPGDDLTLSVTEIAETVSADYLVVRPDWRYTKDHLVGRELDDDIASIVKWLFLFGAVLVVWGTGILVRSRH